MQTKQTKGNQMETKPARIEAYGVKGLKSTPWRKTFKDCAALYAWTQKNDAEVYGQRDAD